MSVRPIKLQCRRVQCQVACPNLLECPAYKNRRDHIRGRTATWNGDWFPASDGISYSFHSETEVAKNPRMVEFLFCCLRRNAVSNVSFRGNLYIYIFSLDFLVVVIFQFFGFWRNLENFVKIRKTEKYQKNVELMSRYSRPKVVEISGVATSMHVPCIIAPRAEMPDEWCYVPGNTRT